jgi:hypothetical protein
MLWAGTAGNREEAGACFSVGGSIRVVTPKGLKILAFSALFVPTTVVPDTKRILNKLKLDIFIQRRQKYFCSAPPA